MNNQFNLEDKERTIGARLKHYASGSGALHFVYDDASGKATGDRPTLRDVKWYVNNREPHLKSMMIGEVSSYAGLLLFEPCKRLGVDEIEYKGKTYVYGAWRPEHGRPMMMLWDDRGNEVKHISTKAAIMFYLEHEKELDNLIYQGGL